MAAASDAFGRLAVDLDRRLEKMATTRVGYLRAPVWVVHGCEITPTGHLEKFKLKIVMSK